MVKVIIIFLLFFITTGCEKYEPPVVELCITLVTTDMATGADSAKCFCIDKNLLTWESGNDFEDNFNTLLITRVNAQMKGHPLLNDVTEYLTLNKKTIMRTKEYTMPIAYCRGYYAVGPTQKASLENWAETNRAARVTCERDLADTSNW